jgi:hypothetical protein
MKRANLIWLVVVLVVSGFLVHLRSVRWHQAADPCREKIVQVTKALHAYSLDHFSDSPEYPEHLSELVPKYISRDLWQGNLIYTRDADRKGFDLVSVYNHDGCQATEGGPVWLLPDYVASHSGK